MTESSIVRRSSFAGHIRQKHPGIAHLVTKEFLDELEGPHILKPRNRRGRTRRSAIMPDPRILSKNIEDRLYGRSQSRCAPTINNDVKAPCFSSPTDLGVSNAIDSKVGWERVRRDAVGRLTYVQVFETQPSCTMDVALPFAYGGEHYGSPYVDHASMASQRALQYTESSAVYQRPPQMVDGHNWKYGLPVYGGPPEYEVVADRGFETRSASSSPGPLTPADVKLSLAYVDPSKVNSYDYSFFGAEKYAAPPLYSFVAEPQGLSYGL
ncbi:hypothetical protein AGABI2DRAFT_122698 [Agaricus bisporus var. bisporus H97]|uniref:hypothetical protein n=1 Tax=Agaricus bisporus var. bisporus (strain H97 / ATCC MYA-4626 / FGSC 10389) TaxID=936046 RepID=UPI00029F703D|nr:hypothetical protein AGABI2DRAFT_122698 [Agaricus bisporus var. bisporus H97]EKV42473.1 hypothetical protein AGABI2DRAFT_122698 [Agaricus bisporus var. bisporus H97]